MARLINASYIYNDLWLCRGTPAGTPPGKRKPRPESYGDLWTDGETLWHGKQALATHFGMYSVLFAMKGDNRKSTLHLNRVKALAEPLYGKSNLFSLPNVDPKQTPALVRGQVMILLGSPKYQQRPLVGRRAESKLLVRDRRNELLRSYSAYVKVHNLVWDIPGELPAWPLDDNGDEVLI